MFDYIGSFKCSIVLVDFNVRFSTNLFHLKIEKYPYINFLSQLASVCMNFYSLLRPDL